MPHQALIRALANSFLLGSPHPGEILSRCERTLGRKWHWLAPVVQRYADKYANSTAPRHRDVVVFLKKDLALIRALGKLSGKLKIERWLNEPEELAC